MKIKEFLSRTDHEIIIICPYIRTDVLGKLIPDKNVKKTIITTWNLRDLQLGSSELDLYRYCKENKITLFINRRIHLKAFINDYSSCFFGSANISKRGLALVNDYNYELAKKVDKLTVEDKIYFKKILNESILVNDQVYAEYVKSLQKLKPMEDIKDVDLEGIKPDPEFLISALPMSKDIEILYNIYSNNLQSDSEEALQCAIHDIILYGIPKDLTKNDFIVYLKSAFFESKFIIKLLDFIGEEKYFGRVKEWIQKNCVDVPVPSRRDLTGNIQVLYRWIVELSDGNYKVDIPGQHSERISKVK